MKTFFAVLTAILSLVACAGAPPKAAVAPLTAPCQHDAQWFISDDQGTPRKAVYVCFGDQGQLLYTVRPLTLEQLENLTALTPPPKKAPAPAVSSKSNSVPEWFKADEDAPRQRALKPRKLAR